ncbi:TPA: hypothetical protein EYP37_04270 [Candidatus Poribacteria bacterium]|nr:hypothetical protein [Candidatus Poribacteria bacterium]
MGVWIAALLTLCIYSFLYKDNPFYKFAEHLFVGVAMGYSAVLTYRDGFIPYVWKYLKAGFTGEPEKLLVILPTVIGILFFMRFIPRVSWLVRYPIAFSLGLGTGIALPLALQMSIYQQMYGTLSPFGMLEKLSPFQIFNALLMVIGVLSTLTYFFFSAEHRGGIRWVSRLGIIFLMIGFGSAFGNTVMGRIAILIGRMQFLLRDWLHLVK